jgi:hypothetical protein
VRGDTFKSSAASSMVRSLVRVRPRNPVPMICEAALDVGLRGGLEVRELMFPPPSSVLGGAPRSGSRRSGNPRVSGRVNFLEEPVERDLRYDQPSSDPNGWDISSSRGFVSAVLRKSEHGSRFGHRVNERCRRFAVGL